MNGKPADLRRALRGAFYRRDGAAVVATLGERVGDDALQLAGDGLPIALRHGEPRARELVGQPRWHAGWRSRRSAHAAARAWLAAEGYTPGPRSL